eukprot:gene8480-10074_t
MTEYDFPAKEEENCDLPQLSLTYGDDTRLHVTVREAAFTCHILASQQLALVKVALVVCNDTVNSEVEASLRFPLPGDAMVCDYTFQQDGATLQAISVPKKKAAAVAYLEKEKGRQVSKTTNVQGNVWQTDIYPLPYQQEREITISLLCKLDATPTSTPSSLLFQLPLTFAAPVRRVSVSVESPDCPTAAAFDNLGGAAADTSLPEGLRVTLPLAEPRPPPTALAATDGVTVHWSAFLSAADLEGLLGSAEEPLPPATSSSPQNLGPIDVGILWDASRSAAAAKDARLALLAALDKEYRQLGYHVAYTVFTFGTAADRVASRVPLAAAQAALLEVQYDGGTDLSLLDAILASSPLQEGALEGAVAPSLQFACFVLLSDGLDNLPGKRLPTLQGITVPVHVPLPAATDQANPTVLRWLAYQTGGVCLPLGGGSPQRCAGTMAGALPQTMITSVRMDLSSDPEALADETLATVPDHRLFRVAVPAAPQGLWVSGACSAVGRRPRCVTVTLERGPRRAEVTLEVPQAAQELPSPLSARLLAVHHAAVSLDEIKLQHYDPDVVVTHATELATRYGLATEHTTLLLLRLPEQFAEHDLQCPEGHPAYDAWQVLAEERLAAQDERERELERKLLEKFQRMSRFVLKFHDLETAPLLRCSAATDAEPPTREKNFVVAIEDALKKGGLSAGYGEYLKWSEDPQLCETPSFFILAAEIQLGDLGARVKWVEKALRDGGAPAEMCAKVVGNVLETKLPDAQTCRVVAYHLLTVARWTEAVWLLELVSDLAPEEPNSYTDLAFARVHRLRHACGAVADVDSELRKAISHLVRVIKGSWASRFDEIEWPCLLLLSWVVGWAEWKWPDRFGAGALWPESELSEGEYRLRSKLPCREGLHMDLFVWLGWDTDHTDVDLHVVEPRGEEVYYGHNISRETGAAVSRDFTEGYGPEVYTCPRAPDGTYDIQTNYFANHQVTGSTGGTSAVIWSIENLGNFDEEHVRFTTTRLVKAKQRQSVLTINISKDSQPAVGTAAIVADKEQAGGEASGVGTEPE